MANYKYFAHRECEFYPCHKAEKLNCLFCYCPLYFLECGGSYRLTSRGLKDCSQCLLPHSETGYDYIVQKLTEAAARYGSGSVCEPAGGGEGQDSRAEPGDPDGSPEKTV